MAITIIKKPTGIYPAYNDSFIHFSSDLEGFVKAEINLLPEDLFPKPFEVLAGLDGEFYFNIKEAVMSRFNTNGFKDENTSYPSEWGININNAYLEQSLTIKDVNDSEEGAEVVVDCSFYRAVKQVGESVFDNDGKLLMNSENGVDFACHYFEGFPMHFTLQKVDIDGVVTVKSLNNGLTSSHQVSLESKAFRMYIDKVSENWTEENFLPLNTGINRLEVYVNSVFKSNLNLIKHDAKCGVYLKWFNADGDYSTYLFNEYYLVESDFRSLKNVATNPFKNVTEGLTSQVASIGKEGFEELRIKASIDSVAYGALKSLVYSPSVQMYSSKKPFEDGEFIDVELKGGLNYSNKKLKNNIELTVVLPQIITQTL